MYTFTIVQVFRCAVNLPQMALEVMPFSAKVWVPFASGLTKYLVMGCWASSQAVTANCSQVVKHVISAVMVTVQKLPFLFLVTSG